MRRLFVLIAIGTATLAWGNPRRVSIRPDDESSPHIRLRVEQPAYTGLPVWLDVEADDPCIAVDYEGDLGGYAKGGSLEVVASGGATPAPGFHPVRYPHGSMLIVPGACPADNRRDGSGRPRIPLHLVADLRIPGEYKVRWLVAWTKKLGALPPTAWVTFVVLPSTPKQREAELARLLAQVPDHIDDLKDTYLPSLLAAWGDPRVMHKLLEIMCSPDRLTGSSVLGIFGPELSSDAQIYLAHLIEHGCLSEGLWSYINQSVGFGIMFGGMPEQQRRRLLQATILALPHAHGIGLAHAINIASMLKQGHDDELAKGADATVLRSVPRVINQTDEPGFSSFDQPKWMLAEYFGAPDRVSADRTVLQAIAAQNDPAAGYALTKLMFSGDPDDLPFLKNRFMRSADGLGFSDPTHNFTFFLKRFGPPGEQLLLSLLQAPDAHVRAAAAVALAGQGNHIAMQYIISTLQSNQIADRIELLNQLLTTDACPITDDDCHQMVTPNIDVQAAWIMKRKEAMIRYFTDRLARQ